MTQDERDEVKMMIAEGEFAWTFENNRFQWIDCPVFHMLRSQYLNSRKALEKFINLKDGEPLYE